MRTTWNFFTAGQLTFGCGAVGTLGEAVTRRKIGRVLVVTDQNLVIAAIVDKVGEPLRLANVELEIFDGGQAEPSIDIAEQAIERAQQFKPQAILGLGGGSNMDLAKITAIAFSHGGSPRDYFGFDNVPGPVVPIICVPTTSGTGSEVSHAAVLTDTENEIKVSSLSNYLRPSLAIVDPTLTLSCPPQVTADSGIDALTHAIEAYTAVDYDKMESPPGEPSGYEGRFPLGDCLSEKAIELIGRHLVRAVEHPHDISAREGMSLAATIAGMAFSNCGVAMVHALEYPLGGSLHCSHGAGNGLLLPYVMRFNLPVRTPALARVARLLGEDVSGLNEDHAAERAITAVENLRRTIGIPERIRDIGGTKEQIPTFAERAFAIKRLRWINPRPTTLADYEEILRSAF
jgi:alcohol dehydrogenase class IV